MFHLLRANLFKRDRSGLHYTKPIVEFLDERSNNRNLLHLCRPSKEGFY